ncbi:MAG: alpha/beta hydrolase [Clostridiales bacterium]|nr:alpha/beta hydrolase [Clostridiales bacterium]
METTVNGLRIRYLDEGKGPSLLLLHGWGAEAATYRLIIDQLSPRFRVVAPDLPGFGGSDEPPNPWNVDDFADFTVAFSESVGITCPVLIGHSNGGRIALRLLSRPGCSLRPQKAVLIDAAGLKAHHSAGYYLKVYSFKAARQLASLPGVRHLFPHAEEKVRRRFGSSDYRQASSCMRQTMVQLLSGDMSEQEAAERLAGVSCPTLLIWGEKDTATPLSDGRTLERLIPGAGLVTLAGAGHFSFAERWGQCRRVLDSFLS